MCDNKIFDTTSRNKRKPTSIILKRGRTITKRPREIRRHITPTNFFKTIIKNNSYKITSKNNELAPINKTKEQDITELSKDETDLDNPCSVKEVIKVDEKLMSGKEIEFCPASTPKTRSPDTSMGLTILESKIIDPTKENVNEVSEKISTKQSVNIQQNELYSEINNSIDIDLEKTLENENSNRKLYIPSSLNIDKNATSKSSLLKDIKGIQSIDTNSYGINISNSRFFVPKNYVFSDIDSSMNDLKFEVDPEMSKLLQKSENKILNGADTNLISEITSEKSPLEDPIICKTTVTKNIFTSADKEKSFHQLPKANNSTKESVYLNDKKKRLFLKRYESKPSSEIVDSLLDNIQYKPKLNMTNYYLRHKNFSTSLDNLDSYRIIDNNDIIQTHRSYESLPIIDYETKNKVIKEENSNNNRTDNKKQNCISVNDNEQSPTKRNYHSAHDGDTHTSVYKQRNIDVKAKQTKSTIKSKDANYSSNNISLKLHLERDQLKDSDSLNSQRKRTGKAIYESNKSKSFQYSKHNYLEKRNSYPSMSSIKHIPISPVCNTMHSITPSYTSNRPSTYTLRDRTQISEQFFPTRMLNKSFKDISKYNDLQSDRYLALCEANRLKRLKFLRMNLQTDYNIEDKKIQVSNSHVARKVPVNNDNYSTNIVPEVSQNDTNFTLLCKDRAIGRTTSLRDKFETIIEDVELRAGRRSLTGKTCDRKSLLVWNND